MTNTTETAPLEDLHNTKEQKEQEARQFATEAQTSYEKQKQSGEIPPKDQAPSFLTKITNSFMDDFKEKNWLSLALKTGASVGGALLAGGLIKKAYTATTDLFSWSQEKTGENAGETKKSIVSELLGGLGITAALAGAGLTITGLSQYLTGEFSFKKITEAISNGLDGLVNFIKGEDGKTGEGKEKGGIVKQALTVLDESYKKVETVVVEKTKDGVSSLAGWGDVAEKSIRDLFNNPSIEKTYEACKENLKGVLAMAGITDFSWLDKLGVEEKLSTILDAVGITPENWDRLVKGTGAEKLPKWLQIGGAVTLASALPLILMRYTLKSPQLKILAGGGAAAYLLYKTMNPNDAEAGTLAKDAGLNEDEAKELWELPVNKAKEYLEILKDPNSPFMKNVKTFIDYVKGRAHQLAIDVKDSPIGQYIPNKADIMALSPINFLLSLKEGNNNILNALKEGTLNAGKIAVLIAGGAVALKVNSPFARKTALMGTAGFAVYCLYQEGKENEELEGKTPEQVLSKDTPAYLAYEGIETIKEWGEKFYEILIDTLNSKCPEAINQIKKLNNRGLVIMSPDWIKEVHKILNTQNVDTNKLFLAMASKLVVFIGKEILKITGAVNESFINEVCAWVDVNMGGDGNQSKTARLEYLTTAVPFIMLATLMNPSNPAISSVKGFLKPGYIAAATDIALYKTGKFIYNIPKNLQELSQRAIVKKPLEWAGKINRMGKFGKAPVLSSAFYGVDAIIALNQSRGVENNDELKNVYEQEAIVKGASAGALLLVPALCTNPIGLGVMGTIQGANYVYDLIHGSREEAAKNVNDWLKENTDTLKHQLLTTSIGFRDILSGTVGSTEYEEDAADKESTRQEVWQALIIKEGSLGDKETDKQMLQYRLNFIKAKKPDFATNDMTEIQDLLDSSRVYARAIHFIKLARDSGFKDGENKAMEIKNMKGEIIDLSSQEITDLLKAEWNTEISSSQHILMLRISNAYSDMQADESKKNIDKTRLAQFETMDMNTLKYALNVIEYYHGDWSEEVMQLYKDLKLYVDGIKNEALGDEYIRDVDENKLNSIVSLFKNNTLETKQKELEILNMPDDPQAFAIYEVAKYFNYNGSPDMASLKEFFAEEKGQETQRGIYWRTIKERGDGGMWFVNQAGSFETDDYFIGTSGEGTIKAMIKSLQENADDIFETNNDTFFGGSEEANTKMTNQANKIADLLQLGLDKHKAWQANKGETTKEISTNTEKPATI